MTARQQRRHEERKARKRTGRMLPVVRDTEGQEAFKAERQASQGAVAPSIRAEVNRQNSQLSTGPRTAEGKARSSSNSFQHGLYSKQLVLPGEDPAELDALRDDLRREHQPAGATEDILVNELAEHYWRLRRMRMFEARAMGAGSIEELHKGLATLPIIQRTMAAAERGFHKALATLRQLQKDRGFVPQLSSPVIAKVSPAAEPAKAIGIPSFAMQDGFVSQNGPIHAAAPSPTEPQMLVPSEHHRRLVA